MIERAHGRVYSDIGANSRLNMFDDGYIRARIQASSWRRAGLVLHGAVSRSKAVFRTRIREHRSSQRLMAANRSNVIPSSQKGTESSEHNYPLMECAHWVYQWRTD